MGRALEDINSISKDDFWLIKKDKKTDKVLSRSSQFIYFPERLHPADIFQHFLIGGILQ